MTHKVAIVASAFNEEIVGAMVQGGLAVLEQNGIARESVELVEVPGAFELPLVSQRLAKSGQYDGIIAYGCVIKGETAHFEYICDAAANGLMRVNLDTNIPVMFGVLTTYNREQALVRSDINKKNKGAEVAEALMMMLNLEA